MKNTLQIILNILITLNLAAVAVYAAPGDLDPTFDGDGRVTTAWGNAPGQSVVIQADGKLVVAGISRDLSNYKFQIWLVRYNTNGAIDTSFGVNGEVRTQTVADVSEGGPVSMALQEDGKIVVSHWASGSYYGDPYGTYVYRYDQNGTLDTTFDNDGIVNVAGVNYTDVYFATSLIIQPDGKILLGVRHHEDVPNSPMVRAFGVLRFNTNGSLDSTFGNNGFVFTPSLLGNAQSEDISTGITLQTDGKIVLVGLARRSNLTTMFGVVRYNPNGSLDTAFDGDGIVTTQIGITGDRDEPYSVGVQSDGKIIVAGSSQDSGGVGGVAVVRYNPNGSLDTSFDGDGKVITASGYSYAEKLVIQPNGKIVVAGLGAGPTGFDGDFSVVRYTSSGSLDSTWGAGGIVTTDFNNGYDDYAGSMAIQSDGKIVVVGRTSNHTAIARYIGDPAVPTAANVSVGGRVSDTNGRGISKARVTITDAASGETQTALTNAFGYYRFEEIAAGQSYILEAAHKRYQFAPRVLNVLDEITDADLIAEP